MPYKDKVQQKLAQARHYQKNKKRYASSLTQRRIEAKAYINATKVGKKCKCGEESNLEYHHLDPNQKEDTLAMAGGQAWSRKRIDAEIKKCKLLCRNCHRLEHIIPRTVFTTQMTRRHKIRDTITEYKQVYGCAKCDEKNPIFLDFHHLNPKLKFLSIGRMVTQGYGLKKIFEEIEKCEVLCANCHAKEHYEERTV